MATEIDYDHCINCKRKLISNDKKDEWGNERMGLPYCTSCRENSELRAKLESLKTLCYWILGGVVIISIAFFWLSAGQSKLSEDNASQSSDISSVEDKVDSIESDLGDRLDSVESDISDIQSSINN